MGGGSPLRRPTVGPSEEVPTERPRPYSGEEVQYPYWASHVSLALPGGKFHTETSGKPQAERVVWWGPGGIPWRDLVESLLSPGAHGQTEVLDEDRRSVSAVDYYFIQEDGSRFKVGTGRDQVGTVFQEGICHHRLCAPY